MTQKTSSVAIIGGGIMGGDIAAVFAAAGWNVHVMSPSQKTRDALPARLAGGLAKLGAPAAAAAAVKTCAAIADLPWQAIDLAIEAALEDLPLKQKLFAEMEARARADIPLVTNTSNFPIGEVGKGLKHRGRVAGLHFFMPAHLVPLVEIVSSDATDPKVAEGLMKLMKDMGKAPIWVKKDVPGFVGNRLQHAMIREALCLVGDGIVSPEGIDDAVRYGFGFRFIACGPMLQKEMSGWDTNAVVGEALWPHLYSTAVYPSFVKDMLKQGRAGMKTKHGFWQWTDESIAKEKARIERNLQAGMEILRKDGRGD
jgi:3-hydroxybutyryl-CoA dehydrogenase